MSCSASSCRDVQQRLLASNRCWGFSSMRCRYVFPYRVMSTLVDWLQNLQNRQLKDREYEYSSLAEVQRFSEVPAGQPLFESLLVFQNYPRREPTKGNKAASATRSVERTSYPLTAIAAPGEELLLRLLYNRASFDDATIMRMLDHWRTLLEAITANSAGRLADLSLLTAAERRQFANWNHTSANIRATAAFTNSFWNRQHAHLMQSHLSMAPPGSLIARSVIVPT